MLQKTEWVLRDVSVGEYRLHKHEDLGLFPNVCVKTGLTVRVCVPSTEAGHGQRQELIGRPALPALNLRASSLLPGPLDTFPNLRVP